MEPYVRIQNARERSGISLRKLAELAGVCNHTVLSKYLRRVQWELAGSRHIAEVAELVADLVEGGRAHSSDSVEELRRVLEAEQRRLEAGADALRQLV